MQRRGLATSEELERGGDTQRGRQKQPDANLKNRSRSDKGQRWPMNNAWHGRHRREPLGAQGGETSRCVAGRHMNGVEKINVPIRVPVVVSKGQSTFALHHRLRNQCGEAPQYYTVILEPNYNFGLLRLIDRSFPNIPCANCWCCF